MLSFGLELEVPQFSRKQSHLVEGFPELGLVSVGGVEAFFFEFPEIVVEAVHGFGEARRFCDLKVTVPVEG